MRCVRLGGQGGNRACRPPWRRTSAHPNFPVPGIADFTEALSSRFVKTSSAQTLGRRAVGARGRRQLRMRLTQDASDSHSRARRRGGRRGRYGNGVAATDVATGAGQVNPRCIVSSEQPPTHFRFPGKPDFQALGTNQFQRSVRNTSLMASRFWSRALRHGFWRSDRLFPGTSIFHPRAESLRLFQFPQRPLQPQPYGCRQRSGGRNFAERGVANPINRPDPGHLNRHRNPVFPFRDRCGLVNA